MKTLTSVLVACVLVLALSCTKASKKPLAQMNGIEFTAKYGFQLPFLDYSNGASAERGRKPKAAEVQLDVLENALLLTNPSGNNFHSTISEDAEWFAFQEFTNDTTGRSHCNANWSGQPVPPSTGADCTIPIPTGETKTIRSFSSDEGVTGVRYTIWLSNKIVKTGE